LHIHYLDPYQAGYSPVHQTDARVKVVLTVAFIFTTALIPIGAWPIFILLYAILFSLIILAEVGSGRVLKRSILALPFVLAALPLVFTTPGEQMLTLDLGIWRLTATFEGLEKFLSIGLKSWISVQVAALLIFTTQFPDILAALRALRLPRLLVAIFGLMWRYLFVLADEVLKLGRARAARSGDSGDPGMSKGRSISWRAKIAGGMAGSLFIRSLDRSERIYVAMLSRGYNGEIRLIALPGLNPLQWTILILGLAILGFFLLLSHLFWG
jgi:cobalt/nickel transport system permease protein